MPIGHEYFLASLLEATIQGQILVCEAGVVVERVRYMDTVMHKPLSLYRYLAELTSLEAMLPRF